MSTPASIVRWETVSSLVLRITCAVVLVVLALRGTTDGGEAVESAAPHRNHMPQTASATELRAPNAPAENTRTSVVRAEPNERAEPDETSRVRSASALGSVSARIVPEDKDDPDVLAERARSCQARAADADLEAFERLAALRELRHMERDDAWPDGVPARTDRVVQSMLELMDSFPYDSDLQIEIVQNLEGSTHPELGERALSLLIQSPDDKVREECAELLHGFLGQEDVRTALAWAAENDPSRAVRFQAEATLGG